MIGILIIAHGNLGESLIHCATHVMGHRPAQLEYLAISSHDAPDVMLPKAQALAATINSGKGVLVLSDIYGATPCNIVTKLLQQDQIEGVAGVNLPMLVRVLNYRHEGLHACIEKAISGGRDGVVHLINRVVTIMTNISIEIINKLGLHARASTKFTQTASQFKSEVWVARNGRKVNAKSIMGVMMLAAAKGSVIEIEATGEDEAQAIEALRDLINDYFGEGE